MRGVFNETVFNIGIYIILSLHLENFDRSGSDFTTKEQSYNLSDLKSYKNRLFINTFFCKTVGGYLLHCGEWQRSWKIIKKIILQYYILYHNLLH